MPSKRAIMLDVAGQVVRVALWADVPAARQSNYATAAVSAWVGAAADENTAIQSGVVAEKIVFVPTDGGVPTMQKVIQDLWQYWQNDVNSINAWKYQGTVWDGTLWNTKGVA